MLEIMQSEDRLWKYRWSETEMWIGGFPTYTTAYDAAQRGRYQ